MSIETVRVQSDLKAKSVRQKQDIDELSKTHFCAANSVWYKKEDRQMVNKLLGIRRSVAKTFDPESIDHQSSQIG